MDCGTEGKFSANYSEVESDEQTMEPTEHKEGKKIWGKKISETEPEGWGASARVIRENLNSRRLDCGMLILMEFV
ncbi:MAG: hypothetical protein B7Z47_06105 [Chthoniobacter sp. 12-60-6]|nr:MAG: hypothetical protein B7Z47_06105 [Chthoniobacter sp. 12-60-6]